MEDFRELGRRLSNWGRWDADMGMTLGEILAFEELAEDCAANGRFDFFPAAPPIKFRGAVGSPINPLAIK
ncbi:hypothetical protein ACFQ07_19905 [Actinomadura adrarensis]|uniref:Cyclase family protein n=1 Tax=Actinomadura adrarensis TaxID=1819600 RepID=A0ABW3CJ11_9ACTN